MTVYEATTKAHSQKIINFIKSEPPDSFGMFCFKRQGGVFSSRFFDFLKQQIPKLQIFVCEDEENKIRCVWGREIVDISEKVKHARSRFAYMKDSDYKKGVLEHLKELWGYIIKKDFREHGIETRTHFTNQRYFDFGKQICGDALTVEEIVESPYYGKIFVTKLDVKKFLEKEGKI